MFLTPFIPKPSGFPIFYVAYVSMLDTFVVCHALEFAYIIQSQPEMCQTNA
jgi:hypothetical protein